MDKIYEETHRLPWTLEVSPGWKTYTREPSFTIILKSVGGAIIDSYPNAYRPESFQTQAEGEQYLESNKQELDAWTARIKKQRGYS